MLNIVIVDDDKESRNDLDNFMARYMSDKDIAYRVDMLDDGIAFFSGSKVDYDIIFLDIKMPLMDGMEAAKKLRANGCGAQIIFVTNMAEYAINGYEVDAISFILKPVSYFSFCGAMDKALKAVERDKAENVRLVISTRNNTITVPASSIFYVEVQGHDMILHTSGGDITCRKTLKEVAGKLEAADFTACNSYAMVNMQYVTSISGNDIFVKGVKLPISRRKKSELLEKFMKYLGGR